MNASVHAVNTRHFVIGGEGLIGSALCHELASRNIEHIYSSRGPDTKSYFLDLSEIRLKSLPEAKVVYLVAAINGFEQCGRCDGNAESWLVNADAPITIARHYVKADPSSFIVFVSSDAVEYRGMSAYARQKTQAEAYMHTINAAIIRPAKVSPERAGELASLIVDVGTNAKAGITRWK